MENVERFRKMCEHRIQPRQVENLAEPISKIARGSGLSTMNYRAEFSLNSSSSSQRGN
jgi:hypothetical protein